MTEDRPPDAPAGIADRLRAATDAAHRAAESTGYVTALMAGRLTSDGYRLLVAQHYFIYEALERAATAMRDDPVAGPFVTDELTRLPALVEDLTFLYGPDWRDRIAPGAATAAYRDRLDAVAGAWAPGFVAHHYTRYLGDLSGGALVGAAIRRTYRWPEGEGTRFYQFDRVPSRGRFKREYRQRLDGMRLEPAEFDRMAAEAVIAFELNGAVFRELETAARPYLTAAAETAAETETNAETEAEATAA